jgi:hypothetical protein
MVGEVDWRCGSGVDRGIQLGPIALRALNFFEGGDIRLIEDFSAVQVTVPLWPEIIFWEISFFSAFCSQGQRLVSVLSPQQRVTGNG